MNKYIVKKSFKQLPVRTWVYKSFLLLFHLLHVHSIHCWMKKVDAILAHTKIYCDKWNIFWESKLSDNDKIHSLCCFIQDGFILPCVGFHVVPAWWLTFFHMTEARNGWVVEAAVMGVLKPGILPALEEEKVHSWWKAEANGVHNLKHLLREKFYV